MRIWNILTEPTKKTFAFLIILAILTPITIWMYAIHIEAQKIKNDPNFSNCNRPAATFYINGEGKSMSCN